MADMQLVVRDLVVRYGDVTAVDRVSFSAAAGEFISLLGPSGCGKTTTLRCIAGLESPSSGEIRIGGEVVALDGREVPPEKRGVNMVFQSYAVWPHMTVFDNVAYGLRGRATRPEIGRRVAEALRMAGLEGFEARYGTELSGGQQQRVAVARAVVTEPRLLLFDEPLSNLDAGLRERMRFELLALQRRLGRTSIYVTHDQAEAMVMSDRIILMNRGRIVQESSPRDLYERPASRFAAEFVGSATLLEGRLEPGGQVRLSETLALRAGVVAPGVVEGDLVLVCIRPENIELVADGTAGENCFRVRVLRVSYLGATLNCDVTVCEPAAGEQQAGTLAMRIDLSPRSGVTAGAELTVRADPASVVIVPNGD